MEKQLLSKSTFIRSLQCSKALYLYKYFPQLRDKISPEQKALFSRGTNVGIAARDLFPGGVDASPDSHRDYTESIARTKRLMEDGVKIIYEAAFQYERVLAAIDILVFENDEWKAYEVKSSTRISPIYIMDASLQYYVIVNSGVQLADISIININNEYRKKGKVVWDNFFSIHSVLTEVKGNYDLVKNKIAEAKNIITNPKIPDVNIGEQCFAPYECDFKGHCWKNISKGSVFELSGISKAEQFNLYNSGVINIEAIPADYPLKKATELQVECIKSNRPHINKEAVKGFLEKLMYPLHFLDFESFMPAIPLFEGCKPYEHIPFQYSLHIQQNDNSIIEHREYLAQPGDPRKEFINCLLENILPEGNIMVYSAAFERAILNNLKIQFPEHSKKIDSILSRIKDLMDVFENRWYYHPAMKGSYSIKNILPALVPELTYQNLQINSGNIAMTVFESLQNENNLHKIMDHREALLEYCKMDTWAMVKIVEKLRGFV